MKKLLLTTILSAIFMSSVFAGITENRKTGETIELNLNRESREIEVISAANNVENMFINFKGITRKDASLDFFATLHFTHDEIYLSGEYIDTAEYALSLLVPIVNVPGVIALTTDLIMLPIKVPMTLFKTMKQNKDYNKLVKAINSNESIRVGQKRFRRIERLLNSARGN